jgi:hypothetical protein
MKKSLLIAVAAAAVSLALIPATTTASVAAPSNNLVNAYPGDDREAAPSARLNQIQGELVFQETLTDLDKFGGVWFENGILQIAVTKKATQADIDALLATVAKEPYNLVNSDYVIVSAKRSLQDLRDATDRVLKHSDKTGAYQVEDNPGKAGLIVHYVKDKVSADAPLGIAADAAVPVDVIPGNAPQQYNRQYDTSPYYGGAAVGMSNSTTNMYATGSVGCSTGFGYQDTAGVQYLLTAGHCYQRDGSLAPSASGNAYLWKQGLVNSIYQGPTRFGSTNASYTSWYTNTGTKSGYHGDMALYKLTTSGETAGYKVFNGTSTSTSANSVINIAGTSNFGVGYLGSLGTMCTSGGVTGEICKFDYITANNASLKYNWWNPFSVTTYNLWGMRQPDAGPCPDHGDSGGAIYLRNSSLYGSDVRATGILNSANSPSGFVDCEVYYTPVQYSTYDWTGDIKRAP